MRYLKLVLGKQIDLPLLQRIGLAGSSNASRVSWHSHSGFEILFLLEGLTVYEFKSGGLVELRGGQFLVVPPKEVHRGRQDVRAPCRICGLVLNPLQLSAWNKSTLVRDDVACIRDSLTRSSRTIHPLNSSLRWIIKKLMDEMVAFRISPGDKTSPAILRMLISAAILEAVRQMTSPPQAPNAIIAAAVAFLRDHCHDAVSIRQLSAHLGYSRSRVFDLFKSEMGLSPNHYLQRIRIAKAQQLLRKTRKSVTEIALESGFSSGQYFCTIFRRYTGIPPARYRKDSV